MVARSLSSLSSLSLAKPCTLLGRHSYAFKIQYDGTDYAGWQIQRNTPHSTIQGSIETSLSTVLKHDRLKLRVCGAGRTDKGVHARGNIVQFYCDSVLDDSDHCKIESKLNGLLPFDIRIKGGSLVRTAPDWMVTVSAMSKTYIYRIDCNTFSDPLLRRFAMYTGPNPLDLEQIKSAAPIFVGTHNFLQFSNKSDEDHDPVKTISHFDISEEPHEGIVKVAVTGTGFLYKQIRHMVGALIALGQGRVDAAFIKERLSLGSSQSPGKGGITRGYTIAEAKGLMLDSVTFLPNSFDPNTLLYPDRTHDDYGRLVEVSGPSLRRQGFIDPDF